MCQEDKKKKDELKKKKDEKKVEKRDPKKDPRLESYKKDELLERTLLED